MIRMLTILNQSDHQFSIEVKRTRNSFRKNGKKIDACNEEALENKNKNDEPKKLSHN